MAGGNGATAASAGRALRALGALALMLALALAASAALAGEAFAEVSTWCAQTQLERGASGDEVDVDVIGLSGASGEAVFLTVSRSGEVVADRLPYRVGAGGGGEGSSDLFVISAPRGELEADLEKGAYRVDVRAGRGDEKPSASYVVCGAWADFVGADGVVLASELIGTATAEDGGEAVDFAAPQALERDGNAYVLAGSSRGEGGSQRFEYRLAGSAADGEATGTVRFVDGEGEVVASISVPGLARGESSEVEIPSAVSGADGSAYRVLARVSSVQLSNPGALDRTLLCSKIEGDFSAEAGHYQATIDMVCGGEVIARDTVDVTGPFAYTAPSAIYKTYASADGAGVREFELAETSRAVLSLKPAAGEPDRTFQVEYVEVGADEAGTDVTFVFVDGRERASSSSRAIGTLSARADAGGPAVEPPARVESGGEAYVIAGEPSDYAYAHGCGRAPVVNVYYVPEGYEPPGPYQVTVDYVDFASGAVIASEQFTSEPDGKGDAQFQPPEELTVDGRTYVLLGGQEAGISHSYYSQRTRYAVYYRDRSAPALEDAAVSGVRVVYLDGDGAPVAAPAAGGGADGDGSQQAALFADGAYLAPGGAGASPALVNESGVDANSERIADDAVPMASGEPGEENGGDVGVPGGAAAWQVVAAALVVALVLAVALLGRRRGEDDEEEKRGAGDDR